MLLLVNDINNIIMECRLQLGTIVHHCPMLWMGTLKVNCNRNCFVNAHFVTPCSIVSNVKSTNYIF